MVTNLHQSGPAGGGATSDGQGGSWGDRPPGGRVFIDTVMGGGEVKNSVAPNLPFQFVTIDSPPPPYP